MLFCKKCGTQLDDDAEFCHICGTPVPKTRSSSKKPSETQPDDFGQTIQREGLVYGVVNLENLPPGYVIDERYEIKAKIGQGGFGAVYRAYDRKMEVDKALKVIPETVSNDLRAMVNLRQEAQIMIRLNHPNIVRVYDFHEEGAVKYIDMEFVDGESLSDALLHYPNQRMSEGEIKKIALQILDGLAYAHSQNVIHRDIKPQNIMRTRDGKIKIMDFGIAETLRTSMSMIQNTSTTGTLVYMAPEQLRGAGISRRSDIYSLGATLYELLNGKPPFYTGDITYQILHEEPKPLPHVSEIMNTILLTCLQKDQSKRFQNCEAMKKALLTENLELETEENEAITVKSEQRIKTGETRATLQSIIQPKTNKKWLGIEWVWVEGGSFEMGCTSEQSGCENDEKPVHTVTLDGFYMSKYVVTFELYDKFCEATGRKKPDEEGWGRGNRPVINVSWHDAIAFCQWLSEKTGWKVRLPTEAEWEYAARGGQRYHHYKYAGSNDVEMVAWYNENSDSKTHPVGLKQSNELGLYDMSGNIWEWCLDWYDWQYYSKSPRNNPQGPPIGSYRVIRGGSWDSSAKGVGIALRSYCSPSDGYKDLGFRLVREK